jgi:toxin ParE1/3/4
MSARRVDVQISRAADRDVENMALYTRRTWGDEQQTAYEAAIYRALDKLSRHPHAGRPRDDLFPGCRGLHVEHHVIFYEQPDDATILVQRILHQSQDAGAAFEVDQ